MHKNLSITNEKTSQNPRRVAHCRVSSLVMVCRRSLANLLATETALLTRRQQSADHKDKVCQVGVTVNTEYGAICHAAMPKIISC